MRLPRRHAKGEFTVMIGMGLPTDFLPTSAPEFDVDPVDGAILGIPNRAEDDGVACVLLNRTPNRMPSRSPRGIGSGFLCIRNGCNTQQS